MAKYTASPAIVTQWRAMEKKENRFLEKQYEQPSSVLDRLEKKVPEKMTDTLQAAFSKAFRLIFEKGTVVIEKTYNKEEQQTAFLQNEFIDELKGNQRTARAFSKRSGATRWKNLLLSGIEGIGLGAVGVAIPDIPIFTGMILKSIYEISLSYGFEYEERDERIFILKLIENVTLHGEALYQSDRAVNRWIHTGTPFAETEEEQIQRTSDAIAMDLLYSKFLQSIPVAGILGGAYNPLFIDKVTRYADVKYNRRLLFQKMHPKDARQETQSDEGSGARDITADTTETDIKNPAETPIE